jgi:hypothetical protein
VKKNTPSTKSVYSPTNKYLLYLLTFPRFIVLPKLRSFKYDINGKVPRCMFCSQDDDSNNFKLINFPFEPEIEELIAKIISHLVLP